MGYTKISPFLNRQKRNPLQIIYFLLQIFVNSKTAIIFAAKFSINPKNKERVQNMLEQI